MNKKKLARVIATWIVTFVMTSVFLLDILTLALCNKYEKNYTFKDEVFDYAFGDDRIHFLNTLNSDCILLESNGHFALIDSGEGNFNPRKKIDYQGSRDAVLGYLKAVCGDENGKVHLDFVLGTHAHYDHIGNFEEIIKDKDIFIDKAYFKEYTPDTQSKLESEDWGNTETCKAIEDALNERGFELIRNLPDGEFTFGDFKIKFYNTVTPEDLKGRGGNAESVGTRVEKGSKSAFLAADFTSDSGLEQLYGDEIGDVDLLKIGHHGYFGSTSHAFLKILKPEITVVTNYLGKVYPNVKWNITMYAKAPIYSCVNRNGIVASFTDDGEIVLTEHAMDIIS